MPAFPDLHEPLTDGAVSLRLAAERDIPEILIAYQDDPRLHLRLGQDRPPSGADLGSRAERAAAERVAGTNVTLTVVEPGSDVCCGQLYTPELDWHHARSELGLWLAPQVRGRGLATRVLRLASPWLFDVCAMARLAFLVEPDNEPMLRAARTTGFRDEGTLRGYRRARGVRLDVVVLSLLPADLRP
jgi:RimJ/RimL family protein N-acetyltransferase